MSIQTEQRAPAAVTMIRRYFPNVDRIADATKPFVVEVTGKDLEGAKKKSENGCVMAQACERQPGVDGAIIKTTSAYIIKGNLAIRYRTTPGVQREIVSFDRHKDFRTGTYHLAHVPASCRMDKPRSADRRRRHDKNKGVKIHRRRIMHRTEGIRGLTPHDGK